LLCQIYKLVNMSTFRPRIYLLFLYCLIKTKKPQKAKILEVMKKKQMTKKDKDNCFLIIISNTLSIVIRNFSNNIFLEENVNMTQQVRKFLYGIDISNIKMCQKRCIRNMPYIMCNTFILQMSTKFVTIFRNCLSRYIHFHIFILNI